MQFEIYISSTCNSHVVIHSRFCSNYMADSHFVIIATAENKLLLKLIV